VIRYGTRIPVWAFRDRVMIIIIIIIIIILFHSIQFFLIQVPSQQLQGQLQTQHSVGTRIIIIIIISNKRKGASETKKKALSTLLHVIAYVLHHLPNVLVLTANKNGITIKNSAL
jgi:hypothetical protein